MPTIDLETTSTSHSRCTGDFLAWLQDASARPDAGTARSSSMARARSSLTVRTLHHYDAIGLVQPSGRSASGYRLYNACDIERLHAVQSLKQLGLSLEAIGTALAGNGIAPLELIDRQIKEVERALEQARDLKEKLQLLRDTLANDAGDADKTTALLGGQ